MPMPLNLRSSYELTSMRWRPRVRLQGWSEQGGVMADPTFDNIRLERSEGIATITLNRPEKLNALSTELLADLSAALDIVEADHDARVVILTGAGRAFSSGF